MWGRGWRWYVRRRRAAGAAEVCAPSLGGRPRARHGVLRVLDLPPTGALEGAARAVAGAIVALPLIIRPAPACMQGACSGAEGQGGGGGEWRRGRAVKAGGGGRRAGFGPRQSCSAEAARLPRGGLAPGAHHA